MELTLTAPEAEYLEALLKETLSRLRMEVSHTHDRRFKEKLKADEALVEGVLGKVAALAVAAS